jgi:maleate cis-trans isomerase
MAYTSWRGVLGIIKPTMRPGSLEEQIRLMPEGIGVVPLLNKVRRGALEEFASALDAYEEKTAELAEAKVDVIHPGGTPPFMLQGYDGEARLIESWEKKYGVPIFTSGQNQVAALRALKVKKLVSIRATTWDEGNRTVGGYFTAAGFKVLAIERMDVPWESIGSLSSQEVYRHIKKMVLAHPEAEGIHMLGGGFRVLDMIETIERDLGIPMCHPSTAVVWETQKRLRVHEPRQGYGRLLSELP